MPPAARISDYHTCPQWTGDVPHVGGPVTTGAYTVLIGGQPAGRVGDMLVCIGPPDVIAQGDPTVLIGGQPAARQGDRTAHGGVIVAGCPTVLIGTATAGTSCLCEAAKNGTPFVDMGRPPEPQPGQEPPTTPDKQGQKPHDKSTNHWFDLTLKIAEDRDRKPWWPVERHPKTCPNEDFHITLAGTEPLHKLDSQGHVLIQNIPDGNAQVLFYNFYSKIQIIFDTETKYEPHKSLL